MSTERPEKHGARYWLTFTLTLALAAMLLAAAGATAYIIIHPTPAEPFTELYLLGPDGRAEGYPSALVIGENKTIIACVDNHENSNETYELAVRFNNSTMEKTAYLEHISLQDNATWEKLFTIMPDLPGDRVKIEFALYKDGDMSSPYRECHIWMNISMPYNYSQSGK